MTTKIRMLLAAVLAIGLVALSAVTAISASAHNQSVTADCDQLVVLLTDYETGGTNHVRATIDGDEVVDEDFGTSFSETFDAPDKYKDYTYEVVVTAWDDPDSQDDKKWSKTISGSSTACDKREPGGHTPVNVCHATSSDTNPYVFITVDDDSTKFQGHLEHRDDPNKTWKSDGVFRGNPVKAGDEKPDLIGDYADHKYDGVITSKSDCGVLSPEQPTGTLEGDCEDDEFVVTGTLSSKGVQGAAYQLKLSTGATIPLSGTSFEETIDAPTGTTVRLQVNVGDGYANLGEQVTVAECDEPEEPVCVEVIKKSDIHARYVTDDFHARVDYTGGELCEGVSKTVSLNSYATEGSTWPTSGTQVFVDHDQVTISREKTSGTLVVDEPACFYQTDLYWGSTRYDGIDGALPHYPVRAIGDNLIDWRNGGHACEPKGTFTVECTATGAQADVGPLSLGDFGPGTFALTSGTFSTTVTSGQQNVVVPVSSTINLRFVPSTGAAKTLDTESSPAACPPPPPTGDVTKTSVPATGAIVAPGSTIAYTVTVKNTGTVPITNAPVVDTLPSFVTAVAGTVSDSGVVGTDGRTITWTVSLAPSATKVFTYSGLVGTNAPAGTSLVNKATFMLKESTTTHSVGSRDLTVVKAVTPTGSVQFGATLTYTLTVRATGNLPQTAVVVTDPVPAGATYVTGSASCDASGPCEPTVTNGVIRWGLGGMAAGATRTVSFRVTVNTPAADANGALPAVEIRNSGAVASAEVPSRPSNEVVTPVAAVLGIKVGQPETADVLPAKAVSDVLAATGAGPGLPGIVALGGLLLLAGIALVGLGRFGTRRTTG